MLPYSIVVKYLPVTDYKGSRIKATCDGKSLVLPFEHSLSFDGNYDRACLALIKKLGHFKGSLSQHYLTRGTIREGERVYSLHSFSNRLEVPKY
jgi:hypothetical protein